jgi:hypothetical protein
LDLANRCNWQHCYCGYEYGSTCLYFCPLVRDPMEKSTRLTPVPACPDGKGIEPSHVSSHCAPLLDYCAALDSTISVSVTM